MLKYYSQILLVIIVLYMISNGFCFNNQRRNVFERRLQLKRTLGFLRAQSLKSDSKSSLEKEKNDKFQNENLFDKNIKDLIYKKIESERRQYRDYFDGENVLNTLLKDRLPVPLQNNKNEINFGKMKNIYKKLDSSSDLRYSVNLDTSGETELLWDYDPTEEIVTFQLHVKSKRNGLIFFGFSDYGEVSNADLYALWTNLKGRHFATDIFTDSEGISHMDPHQDYVLKALEVLDDEIFIKFTRPIDTCDDNDYMIDTGTTHLLFFTSPHQIENIEGLNISHYKTQLQRVQLLKSQLVDPDLPDDTETFTMHVDNVEIPAQETTYWCQLKLLPELKSKHHIIRVDDAISEDSVGVVHHMEVFHCDVPAGTKLRDYNAPCKVHGAERPKGLESCRQVIGAWAMGATGLTYPEEAGYAVGGESFSRYILMEVHYNNPDLKAGIVDSSGIKFYITKQLRKYDAGIMELGMEYTDKYAIPPGQQLWNLNGYCVPDCTQVGLPERGIKVFASQLHTHLTGRRAFTKHFRDGIELPELNRDNHYSPHYQEIRKLHRQVTVLRGDSLVTTCQDSTTEKKDITMGGFAITDEMCVNYIHYYPKAELEVCKSSVTTPSLYGFFNFMKQYQWEDTSANKGILDNFKSIQWKPMNVELLNKFMSFAPLSMQCNQSDGKRFPGEWENTAIPQVLHPLPPEERPCLT